MLWRAVQPPRVGPFSNVGGFGHFWRKLAGFGGYPWQCCRCSSCMLSWKARVSCPEISCCPIDCLSCRQWNMLQAFGFRPEGKNRGWFSRLVQGNQIPHLGSSHVQKCGVVTRSVFFPYPWFSLVSDEDNHHVVLDYMVWDISSWAPRRSQQQKWSREVFWLKSEGSQQPGLDFRERASIPKRLSYLFPGFPQFPPWRHCCANAEATSTLKNWNDLEAAETH